jgi:hypothetical protein
MVQGTLRLLLLDDVTIMVIKLAQSDTRSD